MDAYNIVAIGCLSIKEVHPFSTSEFLLLLRKMLVLDMR